VTPRKRVGVLISGRGSNLQALIGAASHPDYPAEIALVLSNRADAPGLDHARGIATAVISHRDHASRESFDRALDAALQAAAIDIVCLAGFMRVLTEGFVRRWEGRLLNIHPSLLPAFKGLDVHRQVLDAGVRISGCTVHYVVPEVDSGSIIAQAAVPVAPDDDEDSLAARTLAAEHRLYPHALRLVAQGDVTLRNARAVFSESGANTDALFSPAL
jgi:phosphoribosylglycinamide formyltransferase-1